MSEEHINCTIDHQIHQYLFSGTYLLILLLGLPANIYSLYHACVQLRARNELGVYLLNLTVSDLLYLASLPLWLQYVIQGDDWRYREWLCKVCGMLLYENIYISIGFLCCISIDRYLAVVYPFRFAAVRTVRAASLISAFVWSKELAVGTFIFSQKVLSLDESNHSVCFEHYPMKPWEVPVNHYRFFVGFLFPLAILALSYFRVLHAVGKSAGTQAAQKTRIKHLVAGTVLIFLVCFSPYHVFLLARTLLEKDCHFATRIFNYYHFSLLLTSFNCVADPVLYCFISEGAQRAIRAARRACGHAPCCRRPAREPGSDEVAAPGDSGTGAPAVTLLQQTKTCHA
ncbi:ovarian cancer G-protein coupled receptor 1 [Denticeps clupeoides]|uniref:G-protein coupled receptors family 1 profile domain-containing protein n=1 Tax=Denticeps clupeoides TaxID=299321 RepID=A0AAY4B2W3_9TELE|nr:ovarian cancer G-protein coupled receptor 1 [Denticeps clupeoides]XP_028842513.1 ovarian cancer G-protein coupled receptor 1 [Denticeps clupeoides]XP_028842521.1 ovarian cancer G-protein coupled receptor 1 [Denticeps clupeoides]XP_028842530.1 ovarian cancer G-protein coupled receptor 1 [Denticeps clupeoides]